MFYGLAYDLFWKMSHGPLSLKINEYFVASGWNILSLHIYGKREKEGERERVCVCVSSHFVQVSVLLDRLVKFLDLG